jgi:hypothetical protein
VYGTLDAEHTPPYSGDARVLDTVREVFPVENSRTPAPRMVADTSSRSSPIVVNFFAPSLIARSCHGEILWPTTR